MASVADELAWGERFENPILERWAKLSPHAPDGCLFLKSGPFSPFDAYVVDKRGFVLCYVEVKRRRTGADQYGDCICPFTKHEAARYARDAHDIYFVLVTEYGCGTLVEVDLSKRPSRTQMIARRDRPGMKPVKHAVYEGPQVVKLEGPR